MWNFIKRLFNVTPVPVKSVDIVPEPVPDLAKFASLLRAHDQANSNGTWLRDELKNQAANGDRAAQELIK